MNTKYSDLINQNYYFPQEEFNLNKDNLQFHDIDLMKLVEQYGTPLKFTYLPQISKNIKRAKTWFKNAMDKSDYKGKYYFCYCTKSSHFEYVMNEAFKNNIHIASQDVSQYGRGAFTGAVTADQMKDLGINWTLTGHSERRTLFHESDEIVALKTRIALENNMSVILCIGELLNERESGRTSHISYNPLVYHKKDDSTINLINPKENKTQLEIAKIMNVGKNSVVGCAKRLNLSFRKRIKPKNKSNYICKHNKEERSSVWRNNMIYINKKRGISEDLKKEILYRYFNNNEKGIYIANSLNITRSVVRGVVNREYKIMDEDIREEIKKKRKLDIKSLNRNNNDLKTINENL
jgi:hypothetical protein